MDRSIRAKSTSKTRDSQRQNFKRRQPFKHPATILREFIGGNSLETFFFKYPFRPKLMFQIFQVLMTKNIIDSAGLRDLKISKRLIFKSILDISQPRPCPAQFKKYFTTLHLNTVPANDLFCAKTVIFKAASFRCAWCEVSSQFIPI